MPKRAANRPDLRVIQGGRLREITFGSLRIVASPQGSPPFKADAVAVEEDTFLVLSADPRVREVQEHPVRLMTEVLEAEPLAPGTVVVRGRRPLRLLAVVHDLEEEPTWREEWIARALDGIFQEARKRRLQSMALPLLGTLHGSLKKERFIVLLRRALERAAPKHLKRIWLVVPRWADGRVLQRLECG